LARSVLSLFDPIRFRRAAPALGLLFGLHLGQRLFPLLPGVLGLFRIGGIHHWGGLLCGLKRLKGNRLGRLCLLGNLGGNISGPVGVGQFLTHFKQDGLSLRLQNGGLLGAHFGGRGICLKGRCVCLLWLLALG